MRSLNGLMSEIGASLQFFEGFGENWNALEECLCYLDEWLPAQSYVLVVTNSHEVLMDEGKEELGTFLRLLCRVGRWWAEPIADNDRFNRPAVPFHTVFEIPRNLREIALAKIKGVAPECEIEALAY